MSLAVQNQRLVDHLQVLQRECILYDRQIILTWDLLPPPRRPTYLVYHLLASSKNSGRQVGTFFEVRPQDNIIENVESIVKRLKKKLKL